jgi:hypothetical protein
VFANLFRFYCSASSRKIYKDRFRFPTAMSKSIGNRNWGRFLVSFTFGRGSWGRQLPLFARFCYIFCDMVVLTHPETSNFVTYFLTWSSRPTPKGQILWHGRLDPRQNLKFCDIVCDTFWGSRPTHPSIGVFKFCERRPLGGSIAIWVCKFCDVTFWGGRHGFANFW